MNSAITVMKYLSGGNSVGLLSFINHVLFCFVPDMIQFLVHVRWSIAFIYCFATLDSNPRLSTVCHCSSNPETFILIEVNIHISKQAQNPISLFSRGHK